MAKMTRHWQWALLAIVKFSLMRLQAIDIAVDGQMMGTYVTWTLMLVG